MPGVVSFLHTRCSCQSLWLTQSFTCLLRWAWVGPTSANRAGADDLVFISFGGSLREEAQGGFLVWVPQFHLERTDLYFSVGWRVLSCHGKQSIALGRAKSSSSSFPWHTPHFPSLFLLYSLNSCQADYEGKKMMQQSKKSPLSRSKN